MAPAVYTRGMPPWIVPSRLLWTLMGVQKLGCAQKQVPSSQGEAMAMVCRLYPESLLFHPLPSRPNLPPRHPQVPQVYLALGDTDAGAQGLDFAVGAIRGSGVAATAAMPDEPMAEDCPLWLWNEAYQLLLDSLGRCFLCQTQTLREACDVGVHDNPRADVEGVAEDDVGRLATNAAEGD